MTDVASADYFTDPVITQDPTSYFRELRSKCPVMREPHHGAVIVTGYEAALEIFSRRGDTFSNCVSVAGPIPPLPFEPTGDDIRDQVAEHRPDLPWSDHIVSKDGPPHVALRALLTKLLTFERLKQNEDYIRGIADKLIDRFIDRGSCEIVTEYAHAMSTHAITDLLGVPEEEREELLVLLGPTPTSIEGDPDFKIGPDPLSFLAERFERYVSERKANPRDDWMSELAQSRYKDGSEPDVATLARLARFVFGAGQDTSARLMAASFMILGDDQELQRRLRAERDRIPDFIEEVLRFEAPVKMNFRLAQETTTVNGVEVPAGTVVAVGLMAANRDPEHFEDPDSFNIDRPRVRDHLTFSRGTHACPGAPLARLEARVAIERFFDRTSDFRVSDQHHGPMGSRQFRFEPIYMLRSLAELHIDFDKAESA